MNLRRIFRRTRPIHVTQLTHGDIADIPYAFAWDLTLDQWKNLDERDRADKRLNVCYAPNFLAGVGK